MAMGKDEAVETLRAMFDEWDPLTLADVVDAANGNVEVACELILQTSTPDGFKKWKAERESQQQQQQQQAQQQSGGGGGGAPAAAPGGQQQNKMVQVTVPSGTTPGGMLAIQSEGRQVAHGTCRARTRRSRSRANAWRARRKEAAPHRAHHPPARWTADRAEGSFRV